MDDETIMKKLRVYVVCDGGMGSSALGASYLKKFLKNSSIEAEVDNRSANELLVDADIIVTHHHFEEMLKHKYPKLLVWGIKDFVNREEFRKVVEKMESLNQNSVLRKENIKINCSDCTSDEAIERVGRDLVESGYVEENYIEGMFERDHSLSVFMGNKIALPHGEYEYKKNILKSGIVVHVYPKALDWHGEAVNLVIGLAGIGEEHVQILANVASVFGEIEEVDKVVAQQNIDYIYDILTAEDIDE